MDEQFLAVWQTFAKYLTSYYISFQYHIHRNKWLSCNKCSGTSDNCEILWVLRKELDQQGFFELILMCFIFYCQYKLITNTGIFALLKPLFKVTHYVKNLTTLITMQTS